MKTIKKILIYLVLFLLWAAFLRIGSGPPSPFSYFIKSGVDGELPSDYIAFVKKKAKEENIGNVAVVLIENGKQADEFYTSIDEPVDGNTLFNVASISKWLTTWAILKLVEEGKLQLDQPVNHYLTRWKLTSDTFNTEKVTIKSLLSHSSGLNRQFEFNNNTNLDSVPSIEDSLLSSAKFIQEPESGFSYSNTGFGVLQLVIEEVSGLSFNTYLTKKIMKPLGMNQSTFIYQDTLNAKLATFYNTDNTPSPHFRYPELAAGSLYTTPYDFIKFMLTHLNSNPVLDKNSISLMSKKIHQLHFMAQSLGTAIYDSQEDAPSIIGHGGLNRWAINSQAMVDLESKDGVLIFCNGSMDFASNMGDVWLCWKKGIVKPSVQVNNLNKMLVYLFIGFLIIITIGTIKNKKKTVGNNGSRCTSP